MERITNYLKFLEKYPCPIGEHQKGEIEIITEAKAIRSVEEEMKARLRQKGLKEKWAEIGIVYEDQYCMIVRDPVIFPSGATGTYIRVIQKDFLNGYPGVVILPVLNGKIILQKNYRHATRSWEIALPRGFGRVGEDILDTARKELEQETGYKTKEIHLLGKITPNSGLLSSVDHLFYAEVDPAKGTKSHEYSEAISEDLILVEPNDLERMISVGEVVDSYTICSFSLAKLKGYLQETFGDQ